MVGCGEEGNELRALIEDKTENYLGRNQLRDKGKLVDFVLAYQPSKLDRGKQVYREAFETKLRAQGLILNTQKAEESIDKTTAFVKIRATETGLEKVAQTYRLQVPIQESDVDAEAKSVWNVQNVTNKFLSILYCGRNPSELKAEIRPPKKPMYFSSEFDGSRIGEFIIQEGERTLFTGIQRIRMVWEEIEKAVVTSRDVEECRLSGHTEGEVVGMNFLLNNGIYVAVYPLHDSDMEFTAYYPQPKVGQMRHWLAEFWARPGRWNKFQPLDEIRAYFGEKVV